MPRFLSREEWPLIAGGIVAGALTSAFVLYLFFTGIGGESPIDTSLLRDTTLIEPPAGRSDAGRPRGLIALREASVGRRLASMAIPTTPIRGPVRFNARNVVWKERSGAQFVRAESATGRLNLAGMPRGDVVVEDVEIVRPVVALREERGGTWNYETVLAELLNGGENGNGDVRHGPTPIPLIQVRNLRVVRGHVDVQRLTERFSFEALDAAMPVVSFSQPGITDPYVRIQRATTTMVRPADSSRIRLAAQNGLLQLPGDRVRFTLETATVADAPLADVRGVWNPADGGYGVTATGRAVAVRFEDVPFLAPERLPETGVASFAWSLRPAGRDGNLVSLTQLDARSEGSRVTGAVGFRFSPAGFALEDADLRLDPVEVALAERFSRPLPYDGTLSGRVFGSGGDIRFDLTARLTAERVPQPFTTQLTGLVRFAESGLVIQQANVGLDRVPLAALRAFAPGLPFTGVVTGQVSLTGPPNRAPLQLDVRLELATGTALVQGTLDLTGAEPRYDVTGTVAGIDMQSLLEPNVPPVALTARFAINGSGTDPSSLNAALRVSGRFTGWQATAQDTVDVAATIGAGTARVESLVMRLATASVGASGEWRFVEPSSGAVTYRLAVSSLQPFGPYMPAIGDSVATGSLNASGTVNGTLDRMRLVGEFEGADLRVGGWAAKTLATRYDVTTGAAVPTAIVQLTGSQITTPTAGVYSAGTLALQLQPPALQIDLKADRAAGGQLEVFAHGQIPLSGERSALLERARVDLLDRGVWQLARAATIRWGGDDGLMVGNLEFGNVTTGGRIVLDGRVLPLADSDMRLQVATFPVGDLQRLLGRPARLEGWLTANGSVRGGEQPVVDVEFRVENGTFDLVPMQRLDGQVTHRDNLTVVRLQAALDTAGSFELDARLPATLRLTDTPEFDLIDDGQLEGSFTARRLSLTTLQASIPRIRDLRGFIDGSGRLAGTPNQPRLEGSIAFDQGHVRIPELDQSYSEISGRIDLTGSRLVIENLRARSDGWLTANGNVLLEDLTSPVLDVEVSFSGFRPMGAGDQREFALDGDVGIDGPLNGLVLTGAMRVSDGYVAIPQVGGGLDRELVDITRPAPVMGQQMQAASGETWMRNLRIDDLRVDVSDNTWFMAQDARVQLGGTLTVNKNGDDFPIVGTLTGNRGQYTLVAGPIVRRFEVVAAQVRFIGGSQPNPAIDFTARRVIIDATGREVNVDVRIQGNLDRYNVSLASEDLSALPESELTSFLLFGQPSFALGGDVLPGDDLLQQTFVGGFWETLALELERSVGAGDLGLDVFQIRLGGGPFGGIGSPTLVVGRQLATDVFLTVETGISALFDEGESTLNTWAVRLDWAFDRRSRARLSIEPVHRGRSLRSVGVVLPVTPPTQQLLLELRRRWAW